VPSLDSKTKANKHRLWRRKAVPLMLLSLGLLSGCRNDDGSFRVRGDVSYDGVPVASGIITFAPDSTKGNRGTPGFAKIKDGKFDTRWSQGRGTYGGPYVVTIDGFKHVEGAERPIPIFSNYKVAKDFNDEDTEMNFHIPLIEKTEETVKNRRVK